MESKRAAGTHKLSRTHGNLFYRQEHNVPRPIASNLLGQFNRRLLYQPFWRNSFTTASRFNAAHMDQMSTDQRSHQSGLRSNSVQPSRCTIPPTMEPPVGMEHQSVDVYPNGIAMGLTHNRSVCHTFQPQMSTVCDTETRLSNVRNKHDEPLLDQVPQPIYMPTLEYDTKCATEVEDRSSKGMHNNYTELDQRNLVPTSSNVSAGVQSDTYTERPSSSCTRSIKIAFGEEQSLAIDGMASDIIGHEKQQRLNEYSTLNEESTAIIFDPHLLQLQQKRYDGTQQRYLNWGIQRNRQVLEFVNAIDVVNYLVYGRVHPKWSYNTILQYKQAILQLYDKNQRDTINNNPYYTDFFSALKSDAILFYDFPIINLQPSIDFVFSLGDNQAMTLLQLTQKLCFLLGITGFSRPLGIE